MNEVERAFKVLEKMISMKLEDNPKSGIILNKGKPDEIRMRYKQLQGILFSLEYHMVNRAGIDSYGICKDCEYFKKSTEHTINHGKCMCPEEHSNQGKCVGIYDTCWRNTNSVYKEVK